MNNLKVIKGNIDQSIVGDLNTNFKAIKKAIAVLENSIGVVMLVQSTISNTDIIIAKAGTITVNLRGIGNPVVSIDWQDGTPVEEFTIGTDTTACTHTYDEDAGNHIAIITLVEGITYVGVPSSSGYSGDWSKLGNISTINFIYLYSNSFSFSPDTWHLLTNVRQYHLMSNPFTIEQIDEILIAIDTALPNDVSGNLYLSNSAGTSAEAIAARASIIAKGLTI